MFFEWSSAFSFDFGRKRPEPQFEMHEIGAEPEEYDEPPAPQRPGVKLGFQKNPEPCECEECSP